MRIHVTRAPTVLLTSYITKRSSHLNPNFLSISSQFFHKLFFFLMKSRNQAEIFSFEPKYKQRNLFLFNYKPRLHAEKRSVKFT